MRSLLKSRQLVAVALFAMGTGVAVAQTSATAAAKEPVRKASASVAEVQKLILQVNVQRDKMIADHEALAKQLKEATEEQRKVIMEKMHEQKKEFEAAQSALHKQIRDEQRRQRQNATPGRR